MLEDPVTTNNGRVLMKPSWPHWLDPVRHPTRKDGIVAWVILIHPWVVSLIMVGSHHHLGDGDWGIATGLSVGLPTVWIGWVAVRNANRPGDASAASSVDEERPTEDAEAMRVAGAVQVGEADSQRLAVHSALDALGVHDNMLVLLLSLAGGLTACLSARLAGADPAQAIFIGAGVAGGAMAIIILTLTITTQPPVPVSSQDRTRRQSSYQRFA